MVSLNKIQQHFINMKSMNTKIKLGMLELATGSALVSETPEPDVLGNTGVIELSSHNYKWKQEENRIVEVLF